jgi:hypothetical protein
MSTEVNWVRATTAMTQHINIIMLRTIATDYQTSNFQAIVFLIKLGTTDKYVSKSDVRLTFGENSPRTL